MVSTPMNRESVSIVGTLLVRNIEEIQQTARRVISDDDPVQFMVVALDAA